MNTVSNEYSFMKDTIYTYTLGRLWPQNEKASYAHLKVGESESESTWTISRISPLGPLRGPKIAKAKQSALNFF